MSHYDYRRSRRPVTDFRLGKISVLADARDRETRGTSPRRPTVRTPGRSTSWLPLARPPSRFLNLKTNSIAARHLRPLLQNVNENRSLHRPTRSHLAGAASSSCDGRDHPAISDLPLLGRAPFAGGLPRSTQPATYLCSRARFSDHGAEGAACWSAPAPRSRMRLPEWAGPHAGHSVICDDHESEAHGAQCPSSGIRRASLPASSDHRRPSIAAN